MRERVCGEVWAAKGKTLPPPLFRKAAVGNLTGVNKRIVNVQTKAGSH